MRMKVLLQMVVIIIIMKIVIKILDRNGTATSTTSTNVDGKIVNNNASLAYQTSAWTLLELLTNVI